jgi:hypothetical protein
VGHWNLGFLARPGPRVAGTASAAAAAGRRRAPPGRRVATPPSRFYGVTFESTRATSGPSLRLRRTRRPSARPPGPTQPIKAELPTIAIRLLKRARSTMSSFHLRRSTRTGPERRRLSMETRGVSEIAARYGQIDLPSPRVFVSAWPKLRHGLYFVGAYYLLIRCQQQPRAQVRDPRRASVRGDRTS